MTGTFGCTPSARCRIIPSAQLRVGNGSTEGECAAAAVASPWAVDRSLKANPERLETLFVAIGPKTAQAARSAGCTRAIESPRPTFDDVCPTVLSALR